MAHFHLAQINIARIVAPLDDPRMAGFVTQLDPINALAEKSPGFIWRLQGESGNATDLPYNEDPFTLVNMSVWESIESLRHYTYQSQHVEFFRKRSQWFEKASIPTYCLWWTPAGNLPTVAEGRERLEHYRQHGPTPFAFWFSQWFPAPSAEAVLT